MHKIPDFSDLEGSGDAPDFLSAQAAYAKADPARAKAQDRCRVCNGTGHFTSKYTGRIVGDCFRCKGTGSVSKGTNERVEKARVTKRANEQARERERLERLSAFAAEHKAELEYLGARSERWEFAASLLKQFAERGSLTERQLEVVRQSMQRDAERAQKQTAAAAANEPISGLDLAKLPPGRYAVPGGDTRLKVLIKKPVPPSKWAGWTFVSDAAEYGQRKNYGRQAPGRAYSGAIVTELTAIATDPKAAAAAYGHLTGTCGICGRHLEDAESIARGIGPICAGKVGW